MLLPPNDSTADFGLMPRELIFVIDTSGSMHGTSIEQAKRALVLALDGLRPADRFNIIQFNSVTWSLYPQSVTADPAYIRTAKSYVRSLTAEGGTNMRPALEKALWITASETHLRQIIFKESSFKISNGLGALCIYFEQSSLLPTTSTSLDM